MGQLLVTRQVKFEAAHRLESWIHSKCFKLHGHSWVLEATWRGVMRSDTSAVVDFAILGDILDAHVFRKWDHQNLNEVEAHPDVTSEYLAAMAFRRIDQATDSMQALAMARFDLIEVKVQETSNCWATFRREDQP